MRFSSPRLLVSCTLAALMTASVAFAQEPSPVPVEQAAQPVLEEPSEPAIPAVWEPVPVGNDGASAYGLYLSAVIAGMRGDREAAADLFGETELLTPEQPRVREAAFLSALFAGDLGVAARTAPGAEAPSLLAEAGRLVQVVDNWNRNDPGAAWAVMATRPIGAPHNLAGEVIRPWVAAAAGQWDQALPPASASAAEVGSLFTRHDRALLLEIARRPTEAEPIYRALVEQPSGRLLFVQSYGAYLRRQGRRDDAIAAYDAALSAAGSDAPPALIARVQAAREATRRRARPAPAPTLKEGASIALQAAAASASELDRHEIAAVYLRMANVLHPTDDLRVSLGQTLIAADLDTAGRAILGEVRPDAGGDYVRAQLELGQSLAADDRSQEALTAYRNAHAVAPSDPMVNLALAIQLSDLDRSADVLEILDGPVLNVADQPFEVRFLRGAAYEQMGRLDEAEGEFWAALQLRPDDVNALNYLGYMWVDSGRRVDQGAEMIARAHAAEPDNGNIQDSLGWAQYRMGQYETAVETLEQAVEKEPSNAVINDHLGDAYWRVGRRREAGFQWTRALSLDPDATVRADLEHKLAEGLADSAGVVGSGSVTAAD